ncbi:hypothetical protein SDC9_158556 [bioreactor metagenome]|uniref:Uncharacterized protein n=1 Tax=bioreactor metagenome TaxID=1076179 RepID=A0A645FA44_9ZZZZ
MDLHDVIGKFILILTLAFGFGADDPQNEFMLRHGADIIAHPAGKAAAYIRIAAFQNHAYTQLRLPHNLNLNFCRIRL